MGVDLAQLSQLVGQRVDCNVLRLDRGLVDLSVVDGDKLEIGEWQAAPPQLLLCTFTLLAGQRANPPFTALLESAHHPRTPAEADEHVVCFLSALIMSLILTDRTSNVDGGGPTNSSQYWLTSPASSMPKLPGLVTRRTTVRCSR